MLGSWYVKLTYSGTGSFRQRINQAYLYRWVGKTLTASIRLNNGEIRSQSFTVTQPASDYHWDLVYDLDSNFRLVFVHNESICVFSVENYSGNAGVIAFNALKLEISSVSTLANDCPPNMELERAKCLASNIDEPAIKGSIIHNTELVTALANKSDVGHTHSDLSSAIAVNSGKLDNLFTGSNLTPEYRGDLNDLTENSLYNIETTYCSNYPSGLSGWAMLLTLFNSNGNQWGSQICMDMFNPNRTYCRYKSGGSYGSWRTLTSYGYYDIKDRLINVASNVNTTLGYTQAGSSVQGWFMLVPSISVATYSGGDFSSDWAMPQNVSDNIPANATCGFATADGGAYYLVSVQSGHLSILTRAHAITANVPIMGYFSYIAQTFS